MDKWCRWGNRGSCRHVGANEGVALGKKGEGGADGFFKVTRRGTRVGEKGGSNAIAGQGRGHGKCDDNGMDTTEVGGTSDMWRRHKTREEERERADKWARAKRKLMCGPAGREKGWGELTLGPGPRFKI
jgi:hypothetical protein